MRNEAPDHSASESEPLPPFDVSRLDRISSITSDGRPTPGHGVRNLVLALLFFLLGGTHVYLTLRAFRNEVLPYSHAVYGLILWRGYWLWWGLSLILVSPVFESGSRSLRVLAVLLCFAIVLLWLFCELLMLGAQLTL